MEIAEIVLGCLRSERMSVVIPTYQPQCIEPDYERQARDAPPDCLQEPEYEGIGYHRGLVRAMIGSLHLPNKTA